MKVAFWSNYSGSAVTCNMTTVGSVISLLYRLKLTLISNHFERQSLGYSLLGKEYDSLVSESSKYFFYKTPSFYMRKIISPEMKTPINGSSFDGYENGLYYYFQQRFYSNTLHEADIDHDFECFVDNVEELSDLVFIDLQSQGNRNTLKQLDEADLIVVNLKQDETAINNFFKRYGSIASKCFFLISDYKKDGKYQKKNFAKQFNVLSNRVAIIPHISEFAPGYEDGRIPEYIVSNIDCPKNHSEYKNMWYVKQAAKKIMRMITLYRDNASVEKNHMERTYDAEAV